MAKKKHAPIDKRVKELLGFEVEADDNEVLKKWKAISTRTCKPCWELKYCPYGPLVEQFPILPPLRNEAIDHNEYLKECLSTDKFQDGSPLDPGTRTWFAETVKEFEPENYPESIPQEISDMSCRVFGHICPVVFAAEEFTETTMSRRVGRNIVPSILMRVARRDNYMCQICNVTLRDDEIEFDHIIPLSKGGSSEEHNLRVTCFECNRKKSADVSL